MTPFDVSLGPTLLGGEVLGRLARARATGVLTWTTHGVEARLVFVRGRPERALFNQGQASEERPQVIKFVRGLAVLTDGSCRFEPRDDLEREGVQTLGIDTLGETLVAVVHGLNRSQLQAIWEARGGWEVRASGIFDKLVAALGAVGGAGVKAPLPGSPVASLIADQSVERQRSWAALLALGGLEVTQVPDDAGKVKPVTSTGPTAAVKERPPTSAPASAARPSSSQAPKVPLPADPEARRVHLEIERAYAALATSNHYDVLGVARVATEETLRKAYFEKAKTWHSDRFAGLGLSPEIIGQAADIFRAVEEAHRVLTDPEERKAYDYLLDRQQRGLPTDPHVIMEAEGLFKKGQTLIRKGQGAAAEPILRQAVELNPGEAEFHVYLGFAIYCARGSAGYADAVASINRGLALRDNVDAAREFLGRMAHKEGKLDEAQKHLKAALSLNPRNVDAARELRLLQMREAERANEGGLGALLNKVFKR